MSKELLQLAAQHADVNTDGRGRVSYDFDEHGLAAFAAALSDAAPEGAAPDGFVTMAELRARRTPEQKEAVEAARPAARAEIERLRQSVGLPAAPASGDGLTDKIRRFKQVTRVVDDSYIAHCGYVEDPEHGEWVLYKAHEKALAALASPTGVDEEGK